MRIIDSMIQELEQESVNTRKVLERIPDDKMGWKPHAKSQTFAQLGSQLAESFRWVGHALEKDEFDLNTKDHKPWLAGSKKEMLEEFDTRLKEALAIMKNQPDENLMKMWAFKLDGKKLFELPKAAVLRSMIFNHSYHHRGQLTVYLRLNDIPVPAIYGPSADEQ